MEPWLTLLRGLISGFNYTHGAKASKQCGAGLKVVLEAWVGGMITTVTRIAVVVNKRAPSSCKHPYSSYGKVMSKAHSHSTGPLRRHRRNHQGPRGAFSWHRLGLRI